MPLSGHPEWPVGTRKSQGGSRKSLERQSLQIMRKKSLPKPRLRTRLKNTRDKGDWAEMMFLAKATSLGFIVSRPYGAKVFDFVVCSRKGPLSRVQVKSVWSRRDRMFRVRTCGSQGRRYQRGEVDFIVAYVVPEDAWYVIPLCEISYRMAYLSPHIPGSRARWEKFREAWGLLRGEEPGYGIELQACADPKSLTTEDTEAIESSRLPLLLSRPFPTASFSTNWPERPIDVRSAASPLGILHSGLRPRSG